MTALICVDDLLGMTFNNRRQSQDRLLRDHILTMTAESTLWMNAYSARQFAKNEAPQIRIDEDFLTSAGEDDFCFVENQPLQPVEERLTRLILYRWNRRYPADTVLDLSLEGWTLASAEEFPGYSHETITEEVYTR